jgi:E3 ubiquitin-protein ligase ATL10/75/76/77/78
MQEGHVYSRRALILIAPAHSYRENAAAGQVMAAGQEPPPPADVVSSGSSFDANVVMILAVLLCALICALGLNSIVRCALRCSTTSRTLSGGAEQQPAAAQAGARRKALRAMGTLVYSPEQQAAAGGAPVCAICLADLQPGDRVRVLPKCEHGFHARCVDRWLVARSTCPTCRQPLFDAPCKGSGCAHAAGEEPQVRAFVLPLRPEGFITPYDF